MKIYKFSFYILFLALLLSLNKLLALFFPIWDIAPPLYVALALALMALILGVLGFKETKSGLGAIRNWLTVVGSMFLSILLMTAIILGALFSGGAKLLESTHSQDGRYDVDIYLTNGGATTSFGINGILDGPLWFKKPIYGDYKIDYANVKWINNHTISINDHALNLQKGETYRFSDDPDWEKEHE